MAHPPKPPSDAERQAATRKAEPDEVRYPREMLVSHSAVLLEGADGPETAAALALAPVSQQTFTVEQAAGLLDELKARELDPLAGAPETYTQEAGV